MPDTDAPSRAPAAPVDPAFAIEGLVITRSHGRQLIFDAGDEQIRCYDCGQGLLHLRNRVVFSMNDLETVLLAHLMQRHGWTREAPGA